MSSQSSPWGSRVLAPVPRGVLYFRQSLIGKGVPAERREVPVSLLAFLAVAVIPAGQSFVCTPTRVFDGDGPIWCAEGPRIRVAGIATRDMDGSCRSGQPCPGKSADDSRDALVRLLGESIGRNRSGHIFVRGLRMRCVSSGSFEGQRIGAWCISPKGGDLSCAMVASGHAVRWTQYWRGHRCP